MKKECIILAGGLGTRLQTVVADVPKPMAAVGGKPFLTYLLAFLSRNDYTRVILSVGYKHELIEAHYGQKFHEIELIYALETQPLGTGGAIKKALEFAETNDLLLLNGDSFFDVSLHDLQEQHLRQKNDLTLSVKYLEDFERYGTVSFDTTERIIAFEEKKQQAKGYINGGVYILNKPYLQKLDLPTVFSFEKEILEKRHLDSQFSAYTGSADRYFIDIGIPEDFARAQIEFTRPY